MLLKQMATLIGLVWSKEWDYKLNGADWVDIGECGGRSQSPIDLSTNELRVMKEAQPWQRIYKDAIMDQEVKWDGHTSKVDFKKEDKPNFFTSEHSYNVRRTASWWQARQFHWHAQSEHTIDGKRFDFELHVVHYAKGDGFDTF